MRVARKITAGLASLILGLGLVFQSCGSPAAGMAEKMAEGCPKDMGGGIVLQKVDVEGNYIVRTFTVPDETNMEAVANADKAVSADAVKASDPALAKFLKENSMGVKDVYTNSSVSASLEMQPELFK